MLAKRFTANPPPAPIASLDAYKAILIMNSTSILVYLIYLGSMAKADVVQLFELIIPGDKFGGGMKTDAVCCKGDTG